MTRDGEWRAPSPLTGGRRRRAPWPRLVESAAWIGGALLMGLPGYALVALVHPYC